MPLDRSIDLWCRAMRISRSMEGHAVVPQIAVPHSLQATHWRQAARRYGGREPEKRLAA
jgi:hypothetical protein